MLDCSTVVAMDAVGRHHLLETMGARPAGEMWTRRHSKNRSYQPPDGLESPKHATVVTLATLIGDQRLVIGWRLGSDLTSLGIGALAIDLLKDPVLRSIFRDLIKVERVANDAEDFILHIELLRIPRTMACALLTGNKISLRST